MAGVTALHAAAGPVDMWLRDWYRVRAIDYSRLSTGLDTARRIALIKSLIAHGADVNARITASTGVQGWLTLKNGAFEPFSVGTGDLKGATPLWVAAFDMHGQNYSGGGGGGMGGEKKMSQKPQIINVLLEGGADPNITANDKTTVLMAAAGLGHGTYLPGQPRGARTPDAEEAVRLLVEKAKVDVNVTNEAGFTALHGAAFKGLERGARVSRGPWRQHQRSGLYEAHGLPHGRRVEADLPVPGVARNGGVPENARCGHDTRHLRPRTGTGTGCQGSGWRQSTAPVG